MTLNFHNLIHWPTVIQRWGAAWCYCLYHAENLNRLIRRRCYGTGWVITRVYNDYFTASILFTFWLTGCNQVRSGQDNEFRRTVLQRKQDEKILFTKPGTTVRGIGYDEAAVTFLLTVIRRSSPQNQNGLLLIRMKYQQPAYLSSMSIYSIFIRNVQGIRL